MVRTPKNQTGIDDPANPTMKLTEAGGYASWAIVELFGHQQIAGHLSEQTIGGGTFLRVDVPESRCSAGYTKFFGAGAVYAITPTTEELARLAADRLQVVPVDPWVVPTRQLPAGDDDEYKGG